MFKAIVIKLSFIALSLVLFIRIIQANDYLANLSMTLCSLASRAHELGLTLKPAYPLNPVLSENLNQIIGSLVTQKISLSQNPSKITQTINSLLALFLTDGSYKLENNIVSFEYLGFTLSSELEPFANELLLLANLADYISTNFTKQETVKILSNTFTSPVLYLFLNSLFIQENHKLDLTIIGGLKTEQFKKLINTIKKTSLTKIQYFANTIQISDSVKSKLAIDVYLLNPAISIDHTKNNMIICEKIIQDKRMSIRLFPKKFDNSFLTNIFVAIDQNFSTNELKRFFSSLKISTAWGPQALKNQLLEGFKCTAKQSGPKMIADIILETRNPSRAKLFLVTSHQVITIDFGSLNTSDRSRALDLIELYGILTKTIINLRTTTAKDLNAPLQNNMRFYVYEKTHKVFNKYRSINSLNDKAISLSDK